MQRNLIGDIMKIEIKIEAIRAEEIDGKVWVFEKQKGRVLRWKLQ